MEWINARIKERSTWFGLLGLLGVFGIHMTPDLADAVSSGLVSIASVLAIVTKDNKPSLNIK